MSDEGAMNNNKEVFIVFVKLLEPHQTKFEPLRTPLEPHQTLFEPTFEPLQTLLKLTQTQYILYFFDTRKTGFI